MLLGGIKIVDHLKELEYFKKKSTVLSQQEPMSVEQTKMTFIKYCVQLYQERVAPMVQKLKRGEPSKG
jgi:hypothetical protein